MKMTRKEKSEVLSWLKSIEAAVRIGDQEIFEKAWGEAQEAITDITIESWDHAAMEAFAAGLPGDYEAS